MRAPFEHQATDRSFWIDRHLADRVHDKVNSILVHANDGEDLDRLSDVAQGLPPSRLVEHAVEVGCERCCIACD